MLFALLGVVLVLMNLFDIGPPAAWNYEFFGDLWKFVLPFILAVVWWSYADVSGLSRKREMRKMDERRESRRQRNLDALGVDPRGRKPPKR